MPVPRLDLRPRRHAHPRQAHRGPRRLQPRRPPGWPPVRLATWQGFVFVSLDAEAQELADWLGDLATHLDRFDFGALRVAHTETYEVEANWKFVAENYSECYHCPGIHPQLNKLTPYDLGGDYAPDGPWQGGWMELVDDAETMALDGGHRAGRPAMAGITELDERRIYYYLLWPHDVPVDPPGLPALAIASCRPARITPGSSASGCSSRRRSRRRASTRPMRSRFWDLTNRQDWHVCELQHRGTRSRSWTAGRYSNQEPSVHAFDLMVVDRYADDGTESRRTVRQRYDVPPPEGRRRTDRRRRRDAGRPPAALGGPGQGEVAGPILAVGPAGTVPRRAPCRSLSRRSPRVRAPAASPRPGSARA